MRFLVLISLFLIGGCSQDPASERDAYLRSGEEHLAVGRYEEATLQFRNALQIDKSHVPTYLDLGKAFQKMGDAQNAAAAFQQVLELDDKNVEARLYLGRQLLSAAASNPAFYKQAQEMAEEILVLDALNTEARTLLGNSYLGQGDIDRSIAQLEEAAARNPSDLEAALGLGAAQLRKNEVEKAESTFKGALEKHPDSTAAYLTVAAFLASINRTGEAESYYRKAFDLAPDDPKSLYPFAAFYLSDKRVAEVESLFKEAVARKPDAREPRWGLATFYVQMGLQAEAVNALLELLKANPKDRPARLSLAELYLSQKNPRQAEEIVTALLAANNGDADAHQLLGRILRDRQETDRALEEFDTAIKLDGTLKPAYIEKANLLLLRGDLEGAQNALNAALQRDNNNLLARGFLAKILALRQKPDDALQEAQKVLELMPNNEDAMVARGDALGSIGRLKESRDEYVRLNGLRPTNPFYLHRLGNAETAMGETAAALIHIRKAVEIKPDLLIGINDLMFLHFKARQYDAALAELARLSQVPGTPKDEIHRFRGQVYIAKGDPVSAEREFRMTIETNPQNYQAYILIAQMNLQRNNPAQAIKEVDQLIAKDNKFAPAFFLKGYYLEVSRDTSGALSSYRKALELAPENPLISNNIAWLLCERGENLDEALTLAIKARKGAPDSPEIADTLGWVYYKTKNYTLAVDQLIFSVNKRPKPEAQHFYRLGMAQFAKGNISAAQGTLRKAVELNPSFAGSDEVQRILKTRT